MGICNLCKNWVSQCGIEPAHCMVRTQESFMACDLTTNFDPFEPVEGVEYSKDYIVDKWVKHITTVNK